MFLYFTPLIDMLSTEGNSIRGNMKPLYPKTYIISAWSGHAAEESWPEQNKNKRQIKNVTLL